MTQVTKQLYQDAHAAKAVLTTAIEGLKQIQFAHIMSDAKMAERLNLVGFELQAFLNTWQGIIDDGNQAYQNRPEELILKASQRLLSEIPKQINLEQKELEHRIDAYRVKVEELRKKGLGMQEIDHLCQPVTQEEIDASKDKVTALQDEAKALEAFLADSPRYDVELLRNTKLAPLIESEAA